MTSREPHPDDNPLTLEALVRSWRSLEVSSGADFWTRLRGRYGVSKFCFSMHLPDDDHCYILAAMPDMGTPATMIIPEKYRRELPPLPSILDDVHSAGMYRDTSSRVIYLTKDAVYEADGEGIRRVSEPLEPEA